MIIGGIAAGLTGKPRLTVDIGAMIMATTQDIPRILEVAGTEGIVGRAQNTAEFAKTNRVLLMRHTASAVDIDLSLGALPFEQEVVQRSVVREAGGLSLRLPTAEDLIIRKAVAHRPKDLQDIRTIVEAHPDLDRKRIQKWVKSFGEALDMPHLWKEVEHLLKA